MTLEISNTTPLPAMIYASEKIAQVRFFRGNEAPDVSCTDQEREVSGADRDHAAAALAVRGGGREVTGEIDRGLQRIRTATVVENRLRFLPGEPTMPSLMTRAALLAFALVPALAVAQDTTRVASDSAVGQTARDTAVATADNRPTIPGSIFVGSLVWYPGAVAGALVVGGAVYCDNCSSSRMRTTQYGVFAGAGLLTGLTVGAIARTSPWCSRSQVLRAAVLGAEIGSFGTAAATGLLSDRPIHEVSPYAALALPVVSATIATLLTRRCRQG